MKIHSNSGETVRISLWKHKDGDGEFRPIQTYEAIEEFDVEINDEKVIVYFNKSKSSVNYFYLKFDSLWYWTRDKKIKNHTQYAT